MEQVRKGQAVQRGLVLKRSVARPAVSESQDIERGALKNSFESCLFGPPGPFPTLFLLKEALGQRTLRTDLQTLTPRQIGYLLKILRKRHHPS
jgi:hypothetical protein